MMSEPGKTLEIEDVLSSIRRLVSQDASLVRPKTGVPHRATALGGAQCLVLTPALRVEEAEEDLDLLDEPSELEEPELAEAEGALEADATDFEAPDPDAPEAGSEELEVAQEQLDPVVDDDSQEEDIEAMPEVASVAAISETEVLLLQAENALAGSDALIDEADAALGAPAEDPEAMPEVPDLGLELARLESTIADMEAAVSGREVEFEPEEGDQFEAEGAAPLVDLPEEFDAEAFAEAALQSRRAEAEEAVVPEEAAETVPTLEDDAETLSMAARFGAPAEIGDAEFVETEEAMIEAAGGEDPAEETSAADRVDPDLQDASWAGQEERMDWVEAALNLAQPNAMRRLHLSDAEELPPHAEGLRSSYEDMRAEYARDAEADAEHGARDDYAGLADALIDEEALRVMVAQMIREELRGALGERMTANVRRLVRREIQRALMGQNFE